jgi:proteasome lid subunit RPN8/RPN11
MNIVDAFKKFFGIRPIKEIVVKKEIIEEIIELAKENHPKEFSVLLKGRIKGNTLIVSGLLYQTIFTSPVSTWMKINLPMGSGSVGSVHSHPGPSNRPSGADLNFFSKHGVFHMIICMPYSAETIEGYDNKGNRLMFNFR